MRGLFTWPLFTWSGEVGLLEVATAERGGKRLIWKMLPVVTWWRRGTHGATCFVRLGPKAPKIFKFFQKIQSNQNQTNVVETWTDR